MRAAAHGALDGAAVTAAARPAALGPAHIVDGSPPSLASAATAPSRAASASSRSDRYRLDLPLPLAPVITVSRSSGSTSRCSDR